MNGWVGFALLVLMLGFVAEILCPIWKLMFPDSGAMLVKDRFEIAFVAFAAFYMLYLFCAVLTGELQLGVR